MSEKINSISFQDNRVSWLNAELGDHTITVNRAIESLLPLVINLENIQQATAPTQMANHLRTLASSHDISIENIRFVLPSKFLLVKRILVDQYVTNENFREIVMDEMSQILSESSDNYYIYTPEFQSTNENYREIISVAFKKQILQFFQDIASKADITPDQILVNCFTVDSLFRKFFPDQIGQSLLANFSERGYEIVISDEKNFLTTIFKPYSKSLMSIEQLDDEEILSMFDSIIEEIQIPGSIGNPIYSISQIYLYGSYFKPQWLDMLRSQFSIPVHTLNPMDTREWRLITNDPAFNPDEAYRFVEPLSTLI